MPLLNSIPMNKLQEQLLLLMRLPLKVILFAVLGEKKEQMLLQRLMLFLQLTRFMDIILANMHNLTQCTMLCRIMDNNIIPKQDIKLIHQIIMPKDMILMLMPDMLDINNIHNKFNNILNNTHNIHNNIHNNNIHNSIHNIRNNIYNKLRNITNIHNNLVKFVPVLFECEDAMQ
mmetsp:Transcript_84321/g.126414  ORF Transcript_84321/g.126414 Transcript_84321/m.126414 type:complete len:174 (-) Transcript_84321:25-546(-)